MKRFFLIIVLVIGEFYSFSQSQYVSREESIAVATHRLNMENPLWSFQNIDVHEMIDEDGHVVMYEVLADSMSVLLSGSKACTPILGVYVNNGVSILDEFDELPLNLKSFLNTYIVQITKCFENSNISLFHQQDWSDWIEERSANDSRSYVPGSFLISTLWGQSKSNTGNDTYAYNYYIRSGNNCTHCVVGCGAVAMAQVMNYWKYPAIIGRPELFDWCNMSNTLDYGSSNYELKRNAIAYLMKECADTIGSSFGCSFTGSNPNAIRDYLVDAYGYDSNAHEIFRINYSDNAWIDTLKNQIDMGFPVLYLAYDPQQGGHGFICDGYNANNEFHFNWGWRGTANGFFSINQLTPQTYNFSTGHSMIIDIYPQALNPFCEAKVLLSDYYSQLYQNYSENDYKPYEVVPSKINTLTSADVSSPASWRTIPNGQTVAYYARNEVILADGFTADSGSEFIVQIGGRCPTCESTDREAIIFQEEPCYAFVNASVSDGLSLIYPNPTDGELTMNVGGTVESIVVYNLQGQPVGGWHMLAVSDGNITIDVRPLRSGTYLLCVRTTDGKVATGRFVRK